MKIAAMRICLFFLLLAGVFTYGCKENATKDSALSAYFNTGDTGVQTAGIRMIPVNTSAGTYKVWTKRFGNNPRIKVLLLHGGPAMTHEYMECFQSFFPREGIEFYEYDQLGSYYSDQPTDSSLWTVDRFVEEVEQVRQALGLSKDNFFLLGNSWGGILAMEYALKYQQHLKGLIICNMMASCPDYDKYADEVLAKQMDPLVLDTVRKLEAAGDFKNPKYAEILFSQFYTKHVCRLPEWPEPLNRCFKHANNDIYVLMQGPSEFGIGGRLAQWDRKADLPKIAVPTLTVGARYDTMDPEHMKWMSTQVQKGSYLFCPNGSHLSIWDDQQVFMDGVISFIKKTDNESVKK
jgi:proline iminopeptidase